MGRLTWPTDSLFLPLYACIADDTAGIIIIEFYDFSNRHSMLGMKLTSVELNQPEASGKKCPLIGEVEEPVGPVGPGDNPT